MNIVNKLTLRNLKKNKRRTLVTILGVIISVAMLTAVSTLAVSFLNLVQKQEIANNGEWHVLYKDVNEAQIDAIKQDEATKDVILSQDIGYAMLEDSENDQKPYMFVKAYNEKGFTKFPIELSKGRLPQASDEIVISKHIETNAHVRFAIGDTLTLDIGERLNTEENLTLDQTYPLEEAGKETLEIKETQSYTIVGVIDRPTWEPTWSPGYTVITLLDEDAMSNAHVNASVILNDVNRSLYDHADQLASDINMESNAIQFNNDLLRFYGVTDDKAFQKTLFALSAIIIAIIIVGSVSLIYNAFAISVSERSRHLGMLSSVGATRKQKRNSVFFEGAIIGLISIPIGILSGLAGIGITFLFINNTIQGAFGIDQSLSLTVTPWSLITACAVSILTIFISTYIPAKRASKITAIDAIRQATDVKLSRKAVKTSRLTRKLFGIEAEIGLKNMKRNRRRYQATIFSLAISIVLFLSVSFFTASLQKSYDLAEEGRDYDIAMTTSSGFSDTFISGVSNLDTVTEKTVIHEVALTSWVDKEKTAYDLRENTDGFKNGQFEYYIRLNALDEDSLEAYAKSVGTDVNQLTNTDQHLAIVIDTVHYRDQTTGKFKVTKAIHTDVGETFELSKAETDIHSNLTVAAVTDKTPTGMDQQAAPGILDVVISKQTLDAILNDAADAGVYTRFYLSSSDPMKTQEQIEAIREGNLGIYNVYQGRQQMEQMTLMMSVFVYGFIALITAISIANIFNTISTSISLRKREFAMLKSVGMTPKSFNKMMNYESLFYGIKSLLYGLPVSIGVMYLIHMSLMNSFDFAFTLPLLDMLYVIIGVFTIVGSAMLYSSSKVKKENIIEALKQESI
ncbi:ABC transporter permease [Lentibacillus saliphilus]|uniref:ABC transporter permease n=1 Tax=Lentibacillus saliphilus TaxID=2737028 RepID=UPI001C2FD59F|nr:FtsX-like permease family protein [Lentibacillus saliphilus]